MKQPERLLMGVSKALAWAISIMAAAVVLFRYTVGFLWGSGSDLGMIAAPFVAAFGLVAIAYFITLAVRNVRGHFQKD
jgi:hypothetical protein